MRRCSAALGLVVLLAVGACGPPRPPRQGEAVGTHRGEIRPTDGTGWNGNGYPAGDTVESWASPGGRFRVHYTRSGEHAVPPKDDDASGVPDFVEEFGRTFDQVFDTYVTTLGLREPLSDATYHDRPDYGGDERFDVYLQDQGKGADGYLVTEACASGVPPRCAGYMVVENDFVGYSYKSPQEGMQILASHEFFHAVQHAYRTGMGQAFSEGTAVWGTEQAFPDTNDFEKFLTVFFKNTHRPIDDTPSSPADSFSYATCLWPRFLSERFGEAIVAAVLLELSEGKSPTAVEAVATVLERDHRSTLAEAFGEFGLWNLLTGDRAVKDRGYAAAASYPQVAPEERKEAHPYRITTEIAYLSARYFRLQAQSGERITVTSERPESKVVLHLVSGEASAPTIVSAKPGETSVSIDARGPVLLVAVSAATSGGKSLPLSLVVSGKAAPASDGGVGDGGASPSDEGGCRMSPTTHDPLTAFGALFLLFALVLLTRRSRRARRDMALFSALLLATFTVGLTFAVGCSDDSSTPAADAAVDRAPVPDAPVPLALGQIVDFVADAQGAISGSVPVTGSEELMLLLLSRDGTTLTQYAYSVLAKQSAQVPTPSLPVIDPHKDKRRPEAKQPACRFVDELSRMLATARVPLWQAVHRSGFKPFANTPPKLGDVRAFKISSGSKVTDIDAEAIYVDGTAAFWLDKTTTPLATIEAADLQKLADGFTKTIMPRERAYFGQESDVDADGLVHVLLSALTGANGAVAYVSPCDLIDPQKVPGCATSNGMELIYLTPPSAIQPPYNTPNALLETVAHEFQHNIYFHRKFVLNQSEGKNENPYITEGLSHLAQDLSGYQAGNFYVQLATLESSDLVSIPNALDPKIASYLPGSADGVMRGAGYFVLRYLFDRAGGDALDAQGTPVDKGGIAFLHKLIDQPETGLESYLKASGLDYEAFVEGFWTTLALSNRKAGGKPVSTDPAYNFLPTTTDPLTGRQRGCDLFGAFHASQMVGPFTQELAKADGKLRPGGAELLLTKPPAGNFAIQIQTDAALKAKLRVIRIR